jgi:hypothetical protein
MTQKIDGQFVPLPRTLLESEAWRSLSVNGRRLIDFLMVEWLHHKGKDNGKFLAPYDQLAERGLNRRFVAGAIRECEERGLIEVQRRGKGGKGQLPSEFRLTFLPAYAQPSTGDFLAEMLHSRVYKGTLTQCTNVHSPHRQNRRNPPNGECTKVHSPPSVQR